MQRSLEDDCALPSGNRFRQTRNVSNYLNNVVQQFRNAGMGVNEIMDYTLALVKRASGTPTKYGKALLFCHTPLCRHWHTTKLPLTRAT